MKYHYNSLIIGLALANSTIFPNNLDSKLTYFPPVSIIARSTCQSGINRVVSQIQAKGVPRKYIKVTLLKNRADESNYGNPSNRKNVLEFALDGTNQKTGKYDEKIGSKIESILNSSSLMKTWSQIIADNCSNVASINFYLVGADGFVTYAIQADGTMKRRQCTEPTSDPLPWHLRGCA
jgi:hypothetical protein